jgi:hypothetical protein
MEAGRDRMSESDHLPGTGKSTFDNPVLAEHAAEIRRLGKRAVEDVIEIGRRLTIIRHGLDGSPPLLGHGEWLPWLEREFAWTDDTALNFMRVYEMSKSRNFRDLCLPVSALYMLAAPSTPPEVQDEIIARAEAGEKVTVAQVKTAIARREPEPEQPKPKKHGVNPGALKLFANDDQRYAFTACVSTKAARKFIAYEQQVDLAKQLTEGNIRSLHYQAWVTDWLRRAGRAQSEIDDEERDDLYKEIPGAEIRDAVAAAKSVVRALNGSLLKLEELFKKFPHHPFFGDIGHQLDDVINMIRQYRRAAGERSDDEVERKLARLQELEHKCRTQEISIEGLRSEIEELRGKLEATGGGGDMSISEFQTAIKKWEDTVETQKNIIRDLQKENANLRNAELEAKGTLATGPQTLAQMFNRAVDTLALLDGALSEGPADLWPQKVSARARNQQIREVRDMLTRMRHNRDVVELHSGEFDEGDE